MVKSMTKRFFLWRILRQGGWAMGKCRVCFDQIVLLACERGRLCIPKAVIKTNDEAYE